MSTLFISHSSRDNAIARELERRLARQGHASVFLDLDPEKGLVAGQSWERSLYRKVRACRAVVALITDDYLRSHWCFAEIALARMEGKHLFALQVDPLAADAQLPSILTERQFIDLRHDPEEGYRRLWRGLRDVDVLGVQGEWDPQEPPYLGFDVYEEKHAPLFFGREDEARAGVELLERGAPGMVMTLGASGSGKSSLVRAGVVPRLRRLGGRWLVVEPMRPGTDPFGALAAALAAAARRHVPDGLPPLGSVERLAMRLRTARAALAADGAAPSSPPPAPGSGSAFDGTELDGDARVGELMARLAELRAAPPPGTDPAFVNFLDLTLDDLKALSGGHRAPQASVADDGATPLIDIAHELRRLSGRAEARVLLVVDQFEELLGADSASLDADAFLALLRRTVEAADSPCMVLGTMRSDFLGLLQRHPALRGMDVEKLSLGPMSVEGMRKVIEEPARLGAIELQVGLTERLLRDTETADALPLLSFTLWVLWRDFGGDRLIELSEYERLGGLDGAVVREAQALVAGTDTEALRHAFLAMARLTDQGQFARKPVPWDAPALVPVHAVLERFVERRLLVVRSDGPVRTVEVTHEALFRNWGLLQNWLDRGRAEVLLKQQIARDADSWLQARRDKDALWRGARLAQARELLDRGELAGSEREFIAGSLQRARWIRGSSLATAAAVFLGLGALTTYAFLAKQQATAGEVAALKAQAEMGQAYEELVVKIMPKVKPQDAVPGQISVDWSVLRLSGALSRNDINRQLAIVGQFGAGRVMAVSHDAFIGEAVRDNEIFLDVALRWLSVGSPRREVLYTVGHCETVSSSTFAENRIAALTMRRLGYAVGEIQDLGTLAQRAAAGTVLVVGNAWAAFTSEEIEATERFVSAGGRLMLVGLRWSWDEYRASPEHNFCRVSRHSQKREPAQDIYPMNALAEGFGIRYEPGLVGEP